MPKSTGFTLIETLVTVSIFVILMLVSSNIFLTSIRGARKSEIASQVKQSASYAMATMTQALRSASGITACSSTRVDYKDYRENPGYFECAGGSIASGSANIRLTGGDVNVTACSLSCAGRVININFTVTQSQVGARVNEGASINMQSKVVVRSLD